MKKRNIFIAMLLTSLLSSCSYFSGILNPSSSNSGYFEQQTSNSSSSLTKDTNYVNESPFHTKLYDNDEFSVGLPSTGNVNVLVIPIEIGEEEFTDQQIEDLNLAFNGTSEDTGWESVSTYYNKVSKGKLNLKADITPIYKASKSKSYYERQYKMNKDVEYIILKEMLPHLDQLYDLSQYDYNNDNYVDSIYLVYSCDYSYEDDVPWWAWCYEYLTDSNEYYDGVEIDYYVWASINFLYEKPNNKTSLKINTETFVHETGHLLGLDDYYDYDEAKGAPGGLGGAAMMDSNVGDHDSFSKILMGWAEPTIITEPGEYIINANVTSNECLLIPLRESDDIIFSEYLLIDLYSPTDLNEMQAGNYGLFSKSGVRIYHVDARIDPYLGNQMNLLGYYTIFSFNNSDTSHNLIKLIEADRNNSIDKTALATNSDLFQAGNKLIEYSNYDGKAIEFQITIKSSNSQQAIIIIE